MKEFVEKLIERLDELQEIEGKKCDEYAKLNMGDYVEKYNHGECCYIKAIQIVNQLAEEYKYCIKMCDKDCEVYDKENHYCPKWCKLIRETVAELKEEYNQDSTKNNQGWIPVAERLPEEGEDVLVFFEYFRYGSYNRLFQTIGISYTYNGDWSGFVNGSSGWSQLSILAWQPLPEPYKPEEKPEEPQTNFYTERFNKVL